MKAFTAGGDALLERPINRVELLAQVASLVPAKQLHDEMIWMENAIMALATAIEASDPYAEGHIKRVVVYSSRLGKAIGLSTPELDILRNGGALHDVGKIGIRESVLVKRGTLSGEEKEHIRIHPVVGERICRPRGSNVISEIVRHHHERYDGRGYPERLNGEDIPLAARIMAIADTYDALTSDRIYRKRISAEEALEVIRAGVGNRFDPELVSAFIGTVGNT
ncbi:HD-GYP domain-containing protein [Chloroflexota bacterium]